MAASLTRPRSLLESVFNHVVLPSRLPGKEDTKIYEIECDLTNRLEAACSTLQRLTDNVTELHSIRTSLTLCKTINAGGKLSRDALLDAFHTLSGQQLLVLHVTKQNAGVTIRRHHDARGDSVIFETFEASPASEKVLAAQSLQWDFPGCSIAVPSITFDDLSFQEHLATFLGQASNESVKQFAVLAAKARTLSYEIRDTVEPFLVTQLLATLLEVNGRRIFPPLLRKRVRDDVCWNDAEKPWRRSPFWLVLRVGVQRHLCTLLGAEEGRIYYKFLMCLVLSSLLVDSLDHLHPELIAFLKAKLCRRLVKLEVDKDRAPPLLNKVYHGLFTILTPIFLGATSKAGYHVEKVWKSFKDTNQKRVPYLPRHALPQDQILSLHNSGSFLRQVLTEPLHTLFRSAIPWQLPADYRRTIAATSQWANFSSRYSSLSLREMELASRTSIPAIQSNRKECKDIAKAIVEYLEMSNGAYEGNPEQKSIMILTVMELWVSMDKCAVQRYCLLKHYKPPFPSDILDVLMMQDYHDMCRLHRIQVYLEGRHKESSELTIFNEPITGCFAERYFDESDDASDLQELLLRIESEADQACARKEQEWESLSAQYEDLIQRISESTCIFIEDRYNPLLVEHDNRHCKKCQLQAKADRFAIRAHEYPLPEASPMKKAVVFELACPAAFAAYRDATWKVVVKLALPQHLTCQEPRVFLHEYSELKQYLSPNPFAFSLGSNKKSFLMTHYSRIHFPVDLKSIFKPNAMSFGYYDASSNVWPSRPWHKPSFAHHCQVASSGSTVPSEQGHRSGGTSNNANQLASLHSKRNFSIDAEGPSSYEIIASQTLCPPGVNVHEYVAYQTLCAGKNRRWISLLIEIGSANLNFSSEAVSNLVCHLTSQAGPAYTDDPLRAMHRVFRDRSFCEQLIKQLSQRLRGISANWRETNSMMMVIHLITRLCSLTADTQVKIKSMELLREARDVTVKWIMVLRQEIHSATSAFSSRQCSTYALWSALLCRRTLDMLANEDGFLGAADVHCFVVCSVTVQDNIAGDLAAFPLPLKHALIRDLKSVHQRRVALQQSVKANLDSLKSAINLLWSQSEGAPPRVWSAPSFLHDSWVMMNVNTQQYTLQQTVHYNIVDGDLLIDGQPLGKLPAEYRHAVVLTQLFGNHSLLTFPSGLVGMSYELAVREEGHQIHVGFRHGKLIIRACKNNTILELIPVETFGTAARFDLPASLIHDCVHWLDLETGIMEIRKDPDIWKSKSSNWQLNIHKCNAIRNPLTSESYLVDPYSNTFRRIAQIFDRFEYKPQVTVFQPAKGPVRVELRRLQLSFVVNQRNLLECNELQSEISHDQDAGVWYGLASKLVLKDTSGKRSIVIPMGDVTYKRNDFHVSIDVANGGSYGRYTINEVLGRLECAAEPRLLFLKALLHAYTSFVIPDTLTGRTGTEEALHCLRSGYCQPWTPLNPGPYASLQLLAKLTPRREYYPRDMKVMQKVTWDPELTSTIQNGIFRETIEDIVSCGGKLSEFSMQRTVLPDLEPAIDDWHLLRRGDYRQRMFSRTSLDSTRQQSVRDTLYDARHFCRSEIPCANVVESVILIQNWSPTMYTTMNLAIILQNWSKIEGYHGTFNKVLLSDKIAIDFSKEWGQLVNLCKVLERQDSYQLMFLFATLSFRHNAEMDIIRTLIAFAIQPDLKKLESPGSPCFLQFRQKQVPNMEFLLQLLKLCCLPRQRDELEDIHLNLSFKVRKRLKDAELAYELQFEEDCRALATHLLQQWPCAKPKIEGFKRDSCIETGKAFGIILPEWQRIFNNIELSRHIEDVQRVLDLHCPRSAAGLCLGGSTISINDISDTALKDSVKTQKVLPVRCRGGEIRTLLEDLLRKTGPTAVKTEDGISAEKILVKEVSPLIKSYEAPHVSEQPANIKSELSSQSCEIQELESIVDAISSSNSNVRQQYGRDLKQSLEALKQLELTPEAKRESMCPAGLSGEISKKRMAAKRQFENICSAMEHCDSSAAWLKRGGLWPCLTPVTLLETLRSTLTCVFGDQMRDCITQYAISITELQRLLRVEDAFRKENSQRLSEEVENLGHENWNPLDYPDWLLLEIDANVLIRNGQVDVALATISPASNANSVLQMNMGQGKTSVVIPMVAAVLADRRNLVRVIVPKSLVLQTAQILQARIGGLVGREVRHIPFSRKTSTKEDTVKLFYDIHRQVQSSSGVILALPEHILSFGLSGRQRMSDDRMSEATVMVKVHNWINIVSRDVMDESDFSLAVKTQLIYPSGSQKIVNGNPHRWEVCQQVLHLVDGYLFNLRNRFPQSIEVVRKDKGGFPFVFFLRRDVEEALLGHLAEDICGGRTTILPTRECSRSDRLAIKRYISEGKVDQNIVDRIRQMYADVPAARYSAHLLRGLLVHRILLLALKKRWNVQYGLHPSRDPIAVPFHAKGVPSEQSEWGHPDCAILFTCLAFYYDGIAPSQLRLGLEHLLKSDDPASNYDRWTNGSQTLPDSLRDWNAINVDDETQLQDIWRHIRYNVIVIDYFLNNFVFPKHAKQFQVKLQASGWDIPLFSAQSPSSSQTAKASKPLTTGFSGTNDNRTMLPLTIKQEDLPCLSHTNAEVLTYLLQVRNREYVLAATLEGKHLSENQLLRKLKDMDIRVLIDAGAQILEMDNLSLVKAWLLIDWKAAAAVYFDADNKPSVVYRQGLSVPLLASPFADNLEGCLVYLDEAHTRGTDLKIPTKARGALTLGPGQTKDHTVQAAMRLRQLATSQSVVFFAPPEVHQSILDNRGKIHGDYLDSSDVVSWLLNQTCDSIETLQPLYYSQGADFVRRTQAALDSPEFLTNEEHRREYLGVLRTKEQQTLQQLYEPKTKMQTSAGPANLAPVLAEAMKELHKRRRGFQDTGNAVHASALQEVEQEREVAFEVETVREIQKPMNQTPLSFPGLHKDIVTFVKTGRIAPYSAAYEKSLVTLRRTTLGQKYGIRSEAINSKLYVSIEFTRTVSMVSGRGQLDNYQRQVNYLLWSPAIATALIVIPEEAEHIIPLLFDVKSPQTHLITYAAPVTRKMLHFNNLKYYAMPSLPVCWQPPIWLTIELGIFAGRLYFEYEEYADLCKHLGFDVESVQLDMANVDVDDQIDGSDVVEIDEITPTAVEKRGFTNKPLSFLQEWLAMKRKGQDFVHTPMGYVCQGKILSATHPFFQKLSRDEDKNAENIVVEVSDEDLDIHDKARDEDWGMSRDYDTENSGSVL